ncbi:MAG: hypothetical protein HOP10_03180 [Chitinophagaceae bacterium]|nr:hypothetical protein [Chitinophagaceae bacterium]
MRSFLYIPLIIILSSCNRKTKQKETTSQLPGDKKEIALEDSVLIFEYNNDFKNRNIRNKSDKQVDLLFNDVDQYLDGKQDQRILFFTECLPCQPVQKFEDGLLFAKRLLVTSSKIRYYQLSPALPDSIQTIPRNSNKERVNPKFSFTEGKISMKYTGISCNDADFNRVKLSFPSGEIIIDSLINASFFEYDLDNNGLKEQYLLGTRNCSQEVVLLRIRDRNKN